MRQDLGCGPRDLVAAAGFLGHHRDDHGAIVANHLAHALHHIVADDIQRHAHCRSDISGFGGSIVGVVADAAQIAADQRAFQIKGAALFFCFAIALMRAARPVRAAPADLAVSDALHDPRWIEEATAAQRRGRGAEE